MATTPDRIPTTEDLDESLGLSLERFAIDLEKGTLAQKGVVPVDQVIGFIRAVGALKGIDENLPLDRILSDILEDLASPEDLLEEELAAAEQTVTLDAEFSGEIVGMLAESAKELSQYVAHEGLAVRLGQLAKLLSAVPRYDFRPPAITTVVDPLTQHIEYGRRSMRAVPLNPVQRDDLVRTLNDAGSILTLTEIGTRAVKIAGALERMEAVEVVRLVVKSD